MEQVIGKARRWGNSLGIVLPKDVVKRENIHPREKVRLLIIKDNKPLKELFGAAREWKKTAQQIKDEARRELDG